MRIVPSTLKACPCPSIVAILDIDKARGPAQIKMPNCVDVGTQLYCYDEFETRLPVFFRICVCYDGKGNGAPCKVLPPMQYEPDDDEDEGYDGGGGVMTHRF